MNSFHIEIRIKLSNSNLIQHSKIYTRELLKRDANVHGYSACENDLSST